jgi:hypothetical protein
MDFWLPKDIMNKRKKIFFGFAGVSGLLIILISLSVIFASRFIDMQLLKKQIVGSISQTIHGRIDFQKIDLSFFPMPHVTIRDVEVSVPEKAEGTIKSADIYPALIPLFFGKVRVGKLQMESPTLAFTIPTKESSPPVAEVQKKISEIVHDLSFRAPGLVILIRNGSLVLFKNSRKLPPLKDIDARIFFPSEELKLTANCSSNFSRKIKITAYFNQKNPSLRKISFDVEATEVDIPLTRDMTFALAEDAGIIQALFSFIKGGTAPLISIHSQGASIADLGASQNLFIRGRMLKGDIFIPGPELHFKNVKGECAISKGILDGKNIEAKLDHSEFREGKLKIGLKGIDPPFHLETLSQVDLKELPYHLTRVIKDRAFLNELNGIQKISGYARGKLVLGESLASIKSMVEVSEFNVSAFYQRVPYPIEIKSGRFSYNNKEVHITSVNGSVGSSSFSGVTASLTLGKAPYLEVGSGTSSIALEEIYRWLSAYEKFKTTFKDISSINGSFALSSIYFAGPIYRSQDWRFRAVGSSNRVAINSSLLPNTLTVSAKKFDVTPEQLAFTGVLANMLDASQSISGVLKSPLKGFQNADISMNGSFGPKTASWIKDVAGLTPALRIDHHYSLSKAHLIWEKNSRIIFQGDLQIRNGPHVLLDVAKYFHGIRINALSVDEGMSHATFRLNLHEKELALSFHGKLQRSTLEKLIYSPHIPEGFIEGSFHTEINLEKPLRSAAQGNLLLEKVTIPWEEKIPFQVANMSLEAHENRIAVKSASLTVGNNSFSVHGILSPTKKGVEVDIDLTADSLEWETVQRLLKFIGKGGTNNTPQKRNNLRKLPLFGKLRIKSNTVKYDRFVIAPVYADVSFTPDLVTANVTKSAVCGISISGKIQFLKGNLQLDIKPSSSGQELKPTVECLSQNKSVSTGTFDLSGGLTARGKSDQIMRSLRGNLDFKAKDGRIYKATILAKLFSLINVTGIFQGSIPDLVKEGFSYQSLIIRGNIENGKLLLKEAVLNAPSMQIAATGSIDLVKKKVDVKALVSPLKPVNVILRNIPIIKNIVGRNFASIPVKIEGNLENPEVSYLPVSEVGSGLLGIVKRTLMTPVYLIEPLIPGQKKNP